MATASGFRFERKRWEPGQLHFLRSPSELVTARALAEVPLPPLIRYSSIRRPANSQAASRGFRAPGPGARPDARWRREQRSAKSARLAASLFRFRLRGDADLVDL